MMKDDDFKLLKGFLLRLTNEWMNKRTDICGCRVAFATENQCKVIIKMFQRNNSLEFDGEFQMYTGTDDIYKVGQISKWKNESDLSYYYPDACAELTGSAGEFFPQDRDKTSIR